MIEPVAVKLIWVAAALAAYGLFRWRWLVAMQEVVVGAVYDAEQWSRSAGTSASTKNMVERLTNVAYRPFATCGIAVLVSIGLIVGSVRGLREATPASTDAMDAEASMTLRLLVAVLTTSPVALVLVIIAFCVGLLFRGSTKAVLELMPQATVFGGRLHQPST